MFGPEAGGGTSEGGTQNQALTVGMYVSAYGLAWYQCSVPTFSSTSAARACLQCIVGRLFHFPCQPQIKNGARPVNQD